MRVASSTPCSDFTVAARRGVATKLLPQAQRGVAGSLRVVFVGDRRPEQRHDSVTRVLVDRALEAMHVFGEDLEEAVEERVPLLGVELLGELGRTLQIGEEHRHLLALALEGGLGAEDLVGEVLGGVVEGVALGRCRSAQWGGFRAGRRMRPREDLALEGGHLLHVHELLDQLVEGCVVELELALQRT
jgi:hypothetical protein